MSSSNADNPAHAKSDPCQLLSWDTAFFGIRIARVIGSSLSLESLDAIEKWCFEQKIRCLYFPARSDDAFTVALAEQAGFHLVDIRMTFNRHVADTSVSTNATSTKLKMQKNDLTFRPAIPSDIPQLKAIARISHTDTLGHECRVQYPFFIVTSISHVTLRLRVFASRKLFEFRL